MNPRQPQNRFNIYGPFFDSQGQQKKWFVVFGVFLPLVISILFSVWGTWISIKSYDLSLESNNNRDQIDTLKVIIDQLHQQNNLLFDQNKLIVTQVNQLTDLIKINKSSNDVQTQHFSAVLSNINDSKIPRLAIEKVEYELGSGGEAEFAEFHYVQIINYGGDIQKLKHKEIDTVFFDPAFLPDNGSVPGNSVLDLQFKNPFLWTNRKRLRLRFWFEDALHSKYQQDLTLMENKDGVEFQLGKMLKL